MFGFGKKKIPTGASEKIAIAKKMREAGRYNINQPGGGGGDIRYPSQTVPITLVYVVATLIAMILTGSSGSPLSGAHITGISAFDNFVTGTDITSFVGDPDEDKVFTILGRGLAFFALAGFVPLIAFVLERLFFRKIVMPLVLCWGVIALIMLIYLCVPDNSLLPFFKDLPGTVKDLARSL